MSDNFSITLIAWTLRSLRTKFIIGLCTCKFFRPPKVLLRRNVMMCYKPDRSMGSLTFHGCPHSGFHVAPGSHVFMFLLHPEDISAWEPSKLLSYQVIWEWGNLKKRRENVDEVYLLHQHNILIIFKSHQRLELRPWRSLFLLPKYKYMYTNVTVNRN